MFKMFRDFPLNFHVLSWRASQWCATVSFIGIMWVIKNQSFGILNDSLEVKFTTPLGFVALCAIVVVQLYTYGAYVNKPLSIIYIPAIVIAGCFVMDLIMSYIMGNIGYIPFYKEYLYRYGALLLQNLMMVWVYFDVEFIEVPELVLSQNTYAIDDMNSQVGE